ncbi:MAG TPA: anti-repressor SinI family protein [Bacillales bacterium]
MADKNLDNEWVQMIVEAKQMGIPLDEIRAFLRQASGPETSGQSLMNREKMN